MEISSYKDFCKLVYVSRETFEKIEIYKNLLIENQKKVNLISKSTVENCLSRHFLDSAQLYKILVNKKGNILDFGSGAGFPGLVLSVMGIDNVHLIESNKKKCLFLSKVIKNTSTRCTVQNIRIENLNFLEPSFIISRALAPTDKLMKLCITYLKNSGRFNDNEIIRNLPNLLFLKGKNYLKELKELKSFYKINFKILNSITDTQGKILYYKNKRI